MGSSVQKLMRHLQRLFPQTETGESSAAVAATRAFERVKDFATAGPLRRTLRTARTGRRWPVAPGAYVVGDAAAPVAACTLTSNELMAPLAALPAVAIAGRVYTPNLGIERIILNVTANPGIRYLLLCGMESSVFHPAQSLRALLRDGVGPDGRILGAKGPVPVLRAVPSGRIAAFRRQVELVDHTGATDVEALAAVVAELAQRAPRRPQGDRPATGEASPVVDGAGAREEFAAIRPGGRRRPLTYDPTGFFVITLDRGGGAIVCRHYRPDHTPAHEMRGRSAEAMLLGLLEAGLVSQLSHAGYLGSELAKAETALRLGLAYEQDRPLRAGRP